MLVPSLSDWMSKVENDRISSIPASLAICRSASSRVAPALRRKVAVASICATRSEARCAALRISPC